MADCGFVMMTTLLIILVIILIISTKPEITVLIGNASKVVKSQEVENYLNLKLLYLYIHIYIYRMQT